MADTAPRRCRVCGHFEPHLREHYDAHAATAQKNLTRCAASDAPEAERARLRIHACERFKAGVRRAPRVPADRRVPGAMTPIHAPAISSYRSPGR